VPVFDGTSNWTSDVASLDGWKITKHNHAVTNSESDFRIRLGADTKDYASVTPWHGYFANILFALSEAAKSLSYDTSDAMRHFLAFIDDGNRVWLKRSDNQIPFNWEVLDTGIDSDSLNVRVARVSKAQTLFLAYSYEGQIFLTHSLNEGGNWEVPETIADGTFVAFVISRSGARYFYWLDGTVIKGQIRSPQNEILKATFTAISGVDENSSIAVDESFSVQGQSRITLAYIEGGEAKTKTAKDGVNFS
jgi:hypothetical protein